ncbi:T9SS type A sorting domain-containing protein [Paracrocinitomix mangrovi]|uniref:GH39 family glycosyl hydrolase n=1 Tax=Paracrocinitomix mangrovi TaxID=2862509 RepID=UPI001C8EA162|nr:T9SS type A sorting domain-containing protein [Paracrocinitomix mangrovi]UKN01965.1 T9SS type A sorting domain-containing protein [Paracrocinitomix mangrovi]
MRYFTLLFSFFTLQFVYSQSVINVYPDTVLGQISPNYVPGVFYAPKTTEGAYDFTSNGIYQNTIRTNIIEGALNNTTNLTDCIAYLNSVESDLLGLSSKCDKLVFIFEKMPAWLSSSSDGSSTGTPGYFVLNTKPPASWSTWQNVVESITSTLVNDMGINNAYFEIWNEPDLGSWTGSMEDYFNLYKYTYDGIKAASTTAKIGGPAVNGWANNIYWQPPYGYISNATADSSLISQLIDSAVVWNKIPDFISWHHFSTTYQDFSMASNYVSQKLTGYGLNNVELMVSEWNAPSAVRDTELAKSYMIKAQIEMSKTAVINNLVAAWQDFNQSTNEFHNDYGLITWGAIHKPAYKSILLTNELKGVTCKTTGNSPYDAVVSAVNDTLIMVISNFTPHPLVEALNHTLYEGQFNANQLDSAGYIDLGNNDLTTIQNIYNGTNTIPSSNALNIAINNSIPVYNHYDSIYDSPRHFDIILNGYTSNYNGTMWLIDSIQNNNQFKYDSLLTNGYTQATAITAITADQDLVSQNIVLNNGQYNLTLNPNAVCLIKITLPGVSALSNEQLQSLSVYPNPVKDELTINMVNANSEFETVYIYNSLGQLVQSEMIFTNNDKLNVQNLVSGIYFIKAGHSSESIRFIKE